MSLEIDQAQQQFCFSLGTLVMNVVISYIKRRMKPPLTSRDKVALEAAR
jgi:hypothetical protein